MLNQLLPFIVAALLSPSAWAACKSTVEDGDTIADVKAALTCWKEAEAAARRSASQQRRDADAAQSTRPNTFISTWSIPGVENSSGKGFASYEECVSALRKAFSEVGATYVRGSPTGKPELSAEVKQGALLGMCSQGERASLVIVAGPDPVAVSNVAQGLAIKLGGYKPLTPPR